MILTIVISFFKEWGFGNLSSTYFHWKWNCFHNILHFLHSWSSESFRGTGESYWIWPAVKLLAERLITIKYYRIWSMNCLYVLHQWEIGLVVGRFLNWVGLVGSIKELFPTKDFFKYFQQISILWSKGPDPAW